jgi:hypothetical protein
LGGRFADVLSAPGSPNVVHGWVRGGEKRSG